MHLFVWGLTVRFTVLNDWLVSKNVNQFHSKKINWPFCSGEAESSFQDGRFPIQTFLTIFDLQVTLILPTKFQVNWPFGSIDFQDGHCGSHFDFPNPVFDRQVALTLPTKIPVNWPFHSEDAQNTVFLFLALSVFFFTGAKPF